MGNSLKTGDDLDPEPAHMHAGDKAIHLRTRREGTILIIENRATAVVAWQRLRTNRPAGVQGVALREKLRFYIRHGGVNSPQPRSVEFSEVYKYLYYIIKVLLSQQSNL